MNQVLSLAKHGVLGVALSVAQLATASTSASVTYNGTTIGQSVFGRPYSDCSDLSGDAVSYTAERFRVSASGAYSFESVPSANYSGMIIVYDGSFDPAIGTKGCIVGSYSTNASGQVIIEDVALVAGVDYYLLTTGYASRDSGTFSNTVTGPGGISGIGAGLTKTIHGDVSATGGETNFTLIASNLAGSGASPQSGVVVKDILPQGMTYVSDDCLGICAGGSTCNWTWGVGSLAPGESASCTLKVSVSGLACPVVSNTATINMNSGIAGQSSVDNVVNADAIADPGFEAGAPNPHWMATFTTASPICDSNCLNASFWTPHSGSHWLLFGGYNDRVESASVSQTAVIPLGASTIDFWVMLGQCDTPNGSADFVRLTIDGNELWREDASSSSCYETAYRLIQIPLSASLANGAAHTVRFDSSENGVPTEGASVFSIDDVAIDKPVCAQADRLFADDFGG